MGPGNMAMSELPGILGGDDGNLSSLAWLLVFQDTFPSKQHPVTSPNSSTKGEIQQLINPIIGFCLGHNSCDKTPGACELTSANITLSHHSLKHCIQ